ncbi:MAG: amidohydrolase [Acidobacteriota bacterium]|jgi:hippurate hydrolase|nr:amidohydrolase [Acidobacteriota bacterium]
MALLEIPWLEELVALRRDLHAHPETAFQEARTAEVIARELERYGVQAHRGVGKTGVVGVLKAGDGPRAIGLRADIDALPLAESNSFAHRSTRPGAMHACGHDGHAAMLLGAARHLAEHPRFDGTAVFVFQPGEEAEGGALGMIADGLFQRFPMDAIYGLHNWPGIPAGEMAICRGPVMAGVNRFEVTLRGRGGHAAMPHLANDVIVAASQLALSLQTVTSRSLHPLEPAVVSVTRILAGSAWNVLPEEATLRGTIRILRSETQEKVEAAITRLADGAAAAYGAVAETRFMYIDPPTVNTEAEAARCLEVARAALGEGKVTDKAPPSMAAEDFSYMLGQRPGCYAWLGNGAAEDGRALHSPRYDFDDAILPTGVTYWVRLVEALLAPAAKN